MRVLFVCTANICRSAYAELTARHLAAGALETASAGTHGWSDHPMDAEMAATLDPGVDPTGFLSRALTAAMVAEADLVLTMEGVHRTFVLDEWPQHFRKVFTLGQAAQAVGRLTGADGGTHAGHAAHVDHTGPASPREPTEILRALASVRGRADASLDVPDPYRRGPDAARDAARRISGGLTVVLPALISR